MPPAPRDEVHWIGRVFSGAALLVVGYIFYRFYLEPVLFLIVAGGTLLLLFGLILEKRYRLRQFGSREQDSICRFARSFDRRKTDTWILRAVYEELTRFISEKETIIPVRAKDRFREDLSIDPDELEDLIEDIAYRCRRSMKERNPLYGKINTVRDLVSFLENQPPASQEGDAGSGGPHA